jgi:hypothetical protein
LTYSNIEDRIHTMARPKLNDFKLQIWTTKQVNGWLDDRALSLGVSKSEFIRFLIVEEMKNARLDKTGRAISDRKLS